MIDTAQQVTLLHGDVKDALLLIPDNSVDAVVTDPPYALEMGGGTSGWDDYGPAQFAAWCEGWAKELLRIVKPGGWLVSFGSARTFHRLTVGVEDAGWQIIDSIDWVYPTSFYRAVDLGTRLSKAGYPERARGMGGRSTALTSRHEPAVLARAPLAGTLVQTVAEHDSATLDVTSTQPSEGVTPPNVLLSHHQDCDPEGECLPGCPVAELESARDYFPSFYWCGKPSAAERPKFEVEAGKGTGKLSTIGERRRWRCRQCGAHTQTYMKSGAAHSSTPHPVCECQDYEPIRINDYVSEVSHNTVKPLDLMRWLVRLCAPSMEHVVMDPFAGSGSLLEAAVEERRRVIGVERDADSVELCRVRLRRSGCAPVELSG